MRTGRNRPAAPGICAGGGTAADRLAGSGARFERIVPAIDGFRARCGQIPHDLNGLCPPWTGFARERVDFARYEQTLRVEWTDSVRFERVVSTIDGLCVRCEQTLPAIDGFRAGNMQIAHCARGFSGENPSGLSLFPGARPVRARYGVKLLGRRRIRICRFREQSGRGWGAGLTAPVKLSAL